MVLSENDARLFYRLMWPLQFFVNQRLQLLPDCPTEEAYQKLGPEQKIKVRDALYQNIDLIDEFVKENPVGFNAEELKIVQSFRQFVAGEFFIERYLAKHAIFIKDRTVYAVLGLFDPFDLIIGRERLPAYVKAVLLPFKGRIIADGLLQPSQIFFGSGIAGDLREKYLIAKQNHRIVESLEPDMRLASKKSPQLLAKDWRANIDALRVAAQELKVGAGTPAIQGAVFNLVKTSLEMAHVSVHDAEDLEQLWEQARKTERALRKVYATLNRTVE